MIHSDASVRPGQPVDQVGTNTGQTTPVTAPAAFLTAEDRAVLFETQRNGCRRAEPDAV
jgi:hypothetical protein